MELVLILSGHKSVPADLCSDPIMYRSFFESPTSEICTAKCSDLPCLVPRRRIWSQRPGISLAPLRCPLSYSDCPNTALSGNRATDHKNKLCEVTMRLSLTSLSNHVHSQTITQKRVRPHPLVHQGDQVQDQQLVSLEVGADVIYMAHILRLLQTGIQVESR